MEFRKAKNPKRHLYKVKNSVPKKGALLARATLLVEHCKEVHRTASNFAVHATFKASMATTRVGATCFQHQTIQCRGWSNPHSKFFHLKIEMIHFNTLGACGSGPSQNQNGHTEKCGWKKPACGVGGQHHQKRDGIYLSQYARTGYLCCNLCLTLAPTHELGKLPFSPFTSVSFWVSFSSCNTNHLIDAAGNCSTEHRKVKTVGS